jgi:hypothetical protein
MNYTFLTLGTGKLNPHTTWELLCVSLEMSQATQIHLDLYVILKTLTFKMMGGFVKSSGTIQHMLCSRGCWQTFDRYQKHLPTHLIVSSLYYVSK